MTIKRQNASRGLWLAWMVEVLSGGTLSCSARLVREERPQLEVWRPYNARQDAAGDYQLGCCVWRGVDEAFDTRATTCGRDMASVASMAVSVAATALNKGQARHTVTVMLGLSDSDDEVRFASPYTVRHTRGVAMPVSLFKALETASYQSGSYVTCSSVMPRYSRGVQTGIEQHFTLGAQHDR